MKITLMEVLLLKQKWLRTAAMTVRASSLLIVLTLFMQRSWAQTGLLNDDFSTGSINNWKASTAGATAQIVNGRFVVTMAPQSGGKYRGDFQKTGGVTLNAGAYPIVAIKFSKPPRCNFFFDTNLGSYNGTNNNATKVASATGNVYYWDLSKGTLGTTALAAGATDLTTFQFKVADVVLTSAEVAANKIQFEVEWVKTFASVDELRASVGVNNPPSFSFKGTFAHPGLLHNAADLTRLKGYVANKFGRPYQSYQLLQSSSRSSATYQMAGPYQYLTRDATVTVNGVNGGTVKNGVEADFLAAYYNALMYNINGNEAHAKKATEIIDAYSATTTGIIGTDAELNGLYGFMLANAAELMRYTYSAWPVDKQLKCETMLKNVFYPVLQNFKPCSHGNWDIICMKALMAIAIYTNDVPMFNRVVTYFYHGEGNGSIDNYVLTAAGQLQESNRDQPHVMLALGSISELAEMAIKHGVDLYSASGNAIMRGYEYTAKYNLGQDVDYQTAYDYCEKNYADYTPEAISANGRGQWRSVFEIAYNHYVVRKGQKMPWTLQAMTAMGPEGAPFGADNPGYGSFFFYLNNAPDYNDNTTPPVDTTIGLINDKFTSTASGWAAVTSGSVATVQDGKLNVTLVLVSGKGRGDVKKTAGATLHPGNYPIFAIKFKKPQVSNITFDTNLGSFGNGANKWTGKVGDDIYYYDLTKGGFGPTPTMLAKDKSTLLTTFQFKVADITSGEASYDIEWIKTVKTVADLVEVAPPAKSQTITFDTLATVILGDTTPIVLKATASSGLPVSYAISDTTIASIVNNKVIVKADGTATITASQAGDANYLPATPVSRTLIIKDTISGLIDDNFINSNDGWAAATSGSVATVQNGKLVVTLVQVSGKGRGDVKKTDGAKLLPNNYPIVAIRLKKPQVANITFDTNLGSFGNNSNKWTGIVGDDIYYYDLTKGTFGATATKLPADRVTKLTTFQFKVADITSGETSYAIEWVKTVKSIEDLKNTLPHVQQTISFDSLAAVTLNDATPVVLNATASSGLAVSYAVSDSAIATILNGVVTTKRAGTVIITASQAGDSAYLPAAPVSRTLTINKMAQSISFDPLAAVTLGDATPVVLNATASSGLAVSYAVSDSTIATISNGVVTIKRAGTVTITASQAGDLAYLPAASVSRTLTINKMAQSISFDEIPGVLLGDAAAIVLHASASSNLPVSYTISDSTIATINNGVVSVIRDGTVTITASQSGNADYLPAASVARTLTIAPLNIAVQSLDGDKGKIDNNTISPYLQLVNQGTANVAYSELTARYWFTAENFAGINTFIDYAQLGNSKVKMKYVQLDQPRAGAYGYIEYSFDKSAGNLVANGNSGAIQSHFANTDWSNFNKADDYSYMNNSKTYANNNHITLYRNGQLVWGVEPAIVAPEVKVRVYSATQNGSNSSISTYVTINNEGNVPVAYGDLSVRYWFTADGNAALNAWVDYAKLGNSNIITGFNTVSPALTGADKYFEIKINPALGSLYPATNTGNIQYRIAKADWSNFIFANDYSYKAPAQLAVNDRMTVYYKGQLIFGTEPTAEQTARMATNTTANVIDNLNTAAGKIVLFPNPATDHLNIQVGTVAPGALVHVYSLRGELLLAQKITAATQTISLQSLAAGIYQVEVRNGKTVTTKQIIKR